MAKSLSMIVTEFRAMLAAQSDDYAYGMAMCGGDSDVRGLMNRSYERQEEEFLRANGFKTVDAFEDAVAARTSPKWAFFKLRE